MTSFSQNLEDSLQRSIDYAAQNNHEHVTVEHLLFSLVDDKEAYKVLKACNVDIEKLKEERRLEVKAIKKEFGEKREALIIKYGEDRKVKHSKPERSNPPDKKVEKNKKPIRKPK